MIVVFSDDFLNSTKELPSKLKIKLNKLIQILKENPFHPSLHTKHLSGKFSGLLSFRITRDWRVIFRFFEPDVVQLLEAADRKDIYK
ncbi:MAG: type II toxin-antitoxin system mRNA interferase toxin, RelE/StbE family [Patescibacteria group bacterium]